MGLQYDWDVPKDPDRKAMSAMSFLVGAAVGMALVLFIVIGVIVLNFIQQGLAR